MTRLLLLLLICGSALAFERLPRQEDNDEGDEDGDGEDATSLVATTLRSRQGPGLQTNAQVQPQPPAMPVPNIVLVPHFINVLTQFSGLVNQRLNGTDTPDIPSFVFKHGGNLLNQVLNSRPPTISLPDKPIPTPPPYIQKVPFSPAISKPIKKYDLRPAHATDPEPEEKPSSEPEAIYSRTSPPITISSTTPSATTKSAKYFKEYLPPQNEYLLPNQVSLWNIYKTFDDIEVLQRQFETTTKSFRENINRRVQLRKTSKPAFWTTKYYKNGFPILNRFY